MAPLVSVLLPTRNRLEYLRYAIETVLRQDDPDLEVVVSDNDSEEDIHGHVSGMRAVAEWFRPGIVERPRHIEDLAPLADKSRQRRQTDVLDRGGLDAGEDDGARPGREQGRGGRLVHGSPVQVVRLVPELPAHGAGDGDEEEQA